jgi:glycosyltransferase involved in cell wall biosynthesis
VNLDKHSCEYYTIAQSSIASGVTKKIYNTVETLNLKGISTELKIFHVGFNGLVSLVKNLFLSKSKLIILRFPGVNRTIFLTPIIFLMRVKGHKIVLDLPTPLIVALQEIKQTEKLVVVIYRWIPILLFYPWVLMPFSRIIQSGYEHPYFLTFLKSRTRLIGNGINVKSIIQTDLSSVDRNKKIIILCVAQLEVWHGYDRLLKSVKSYLEKDGMPFRNFKIIIVGDGNEKVNLENLSRSLELEKFVNFTGNLTGENLNNVFIGANLAIASLGSFRVNLKISSPLKSREYTARGLPFVSADSDPDFPENTPFLFKVSNDNSLIDFNSVFKWYFSLIDSGYDFNKIRKYAEINLDFKNKVDQMFLS